MRRRAFTLVELLTIIAIMAILSSMLLPSMARAREMGRRASCFSNLRQIGLSVQIYVQDNDDGFLPAYSQLQEPIPDAPANCPQSRPFTGWWGQILQPYLRSSQVFVCPSARRQVTVVGPERTLLDNCPPSTGGGGGNQPPSSCPPPPPHVPNPPVYSYAFNSVSDDDIYWTHSPGLKEGRHGFSARDTTVTCKVEREARAISSIAVERPDQTIWLADAEGNDGTLLRPELIEDSHLDYTGLASERRVARRHNGQFNALFADGHVKWLPASKDTMWTVQDD